MESSLSTLIGFWWILPLLAVLVFWKWAVRILGVIIVPDDSIGVVTKKFVLFPGTTARASVFRHAGSSPATAN